MQETMDNRRRYNVERSCLRCHERKIRCDRNSPCSRCVRQNVTCQYPGLTRVKRRAPKKNMAEVAARLEQLERSIATIVREQPSLSSTSETTYTIPENDLGDPPKTAVANRPASLSNPPEKPLYQGFLGKDGRYINEPLLSRVLEKEQELQSAIGSASAKSTLRRPPILKAEGLIMNPLMMQSDPKELYPSRWQATQLWHTYLSRVEPLVKVLHVPSLEPRFFAAISRPESVGADVRALLFAIYFGATTALLSDDILNDIIIADLHRFKQGLEISLYNAEFLDAPTITSLQAMVIFQKCFRFSNSGRSGWTLHGVTIRAAQSIGLQRDGKYFKLPELECELRRRLWWQMQAADARIAEDHGLSVPENDFGDTDLPLNMDDLKLSELASEPARTNKSQTGWTEMTFSLIIMETNMRRRNLLSSLTESSNTEELITEFRRAIEEKYLRHSDPDIPIQRFGFLLGHMLLSKTEICARYKVLHLRGQQAPSPIDYEVSQETLILACQALETSVEMHTDELLRGFRWLTTTFTPYHFLTNILWNLCIYPAGPHVERAWCSVNRQFAMMEDPLWPDPGPKWSILVQLRDKALRVRQAHDSSQIQKIADESTAVDVGQYNDIDGLDLYSVDFLDWQHLAQSLSLLQ